MLLFTIWDWLMFIIGWALAISIGGFMIVSVASAIIHKIFESSQPRPTKSPKQGWRP